MTVYSEVGIQTQARQLRGKCAYLSANLSARKSSASKNNQNGSKIGLTNEERLDEKINAVTFEIR